MALREMVVVGSKDSDLTCVVKGSFRPSFGEKSDVAPVKDDGGLDQSCSKGIRVVSQDGILDEF